MEYNIINTLMTVLNKLRAPGEFCEATNTSFITFQLIKIGVQMMQNTHDFKKAITTCMAVHMPVKSRLNFKVHFEEVHRVL